MLNIPVQLDEEMASDTETPPPTHSESVEANIMDTSDTNVQSVRPSVAMLTKQSAILPQKRSASLTEEAETKRQKVHQMAKDLWDTYLKEAQNKPREVFVQLRNAAQELKDKVEICARNQEDFSNADVVSYFNTKNIS
jgi:hypothetical protein